ncbi:MAG TPA: 4a-hydroxytetrahydrobiopterin dehydratase [Candidatus Peribacterales bacterium]|nr:4a-hydroxytetrahydrobiopterin dehydratase [Candidatus Peribacterales bacterium]
MPNLLTKKCVPCEGGATPLTREEAAELGRQTPEWEISDDGKKITRTIKFKNFKETSTFFNKVAEIAENENHHPDFEVHWGSMTLTLWTHAIGGLSENDFIVAAKIDAVLRG